jgi:hypothetical protein
MRFVMYCAGAALAFALPGCGASDDGGAQAQTRSGPVSAAASGTIFRSFAPAPSPKG